MLFPIVGSVWEDEYRHEGVSYALTPVAYTHLVNKGEGGVLPFRVPSFPEDVGSDAVHGGTYVLLFVGSERLVIDDTVFQLIQHSVGRVEGLAQCPRFSGIRPFAVAEL